jgi:uncharacterized protein Veg
MIEKMDLYQARRNMETCLGKEVQLKLTLSKKNTLIKNGVVESTYPNIFVVKYSDNNENTSRVTYSYTDILTKTVEIQPYN